MSRARAHDRLVALAAAGRDVESFWREATEELACAVAFDWHPCWFTLDPTSLVLTSHFNEDIEALDPEVFHNEYVEDDFNKMAELAVAGEEVATLERATGGDRARSRRYRDLLSEYGLGQELVAILRAGGTSWGSVTLYREEGSSDFADDDLEFIRSVAPALGEGARRGLFIGEANDVNDAVPGDLAPAVVVFDASLALQSVTASADHWLVELGGAPGRVPAAVRAVAAAAIDPNAGSVDELPFARLRTRSGTWALIHGSTLQGSPPSVAVIIEVASHDRLGPLLMAVYGLTEREQAVVRQVLRGASTADIAETLHLSPYTVQDHLKSIFDKTGVRSRRQLLASVFFDHFEPRVRDNEARVLEGRMIRGGPWSRQRPTRHQAGDARTHRGNA